MVPDGYEAACERTAAPSDNIEGASGPAEKLSFGLGLIGDFSKADQAVVLEPLRKNHLGRSFEIKGHTNRIQRVRVVIQRQKGLPERRLSCVAVKVPFDPDPQRAAASSVEMRPPGARPHGCAAERAVTDSVNDSFAVADKQKIDARRVRDVRSHGRERTCRHPFEVVVGQETFQYMLAFGCLDQFK